MPTPPMRLSAPDHPRRPPRELTERERDGLLRIADALIPEAHDLPAASRAPEYERWLSRSLTARAESFEVVAAEGDAHCGLDPSAVTSSLRAMSEERPEVFQPLSAILAGAYLMVPDVRQGIGYPGQERRRPRFDEAADEIMDGILDPVIERGPIYTPA